MCFLIKTRKQTLASWIDPWLVLIWLGVLLLLFRPVVHGYDPVGYLSWVRSAVIQGNLNVTDEFEHYGISHVRPTASTGYKASPWGVGAPLLWVPFYLLAHGLVRFAGFLGGTAPADGYSWPYPLACALGSAVYALVGLILLKRLIEERLGEEGARLAVLTVWLASPLVFYMSANPLMSHACEFFTIVLFLFFWIRTEEDGPVGWLLLGLAGGLAMSVRVQNAPLLVLAIFFCCLEPFGIRKPLFVRVRSVIWLSIGALVGFLPQMIVWKVVFGSWLLTNPYATSGETFDWSSPHLLDVLFSSTRGLFVWIPAAVPGVWGLVILSRRHTRLAAMLIPHALCQVYVIGSWHVWWGAASFGPRLLTSVLPALALGLAVFLGHWRRHVQYGYFLCGLFVAWNLLLLARYGLEDLPRNAQISWEQLILGQFQFLARLPHYMTRVMEGLLRQVS